MHAQADTEGDADLAFLHYQQSYWAGETWPEAVRTAIRRFAERTGTPATILRVHPRSVRRDLAPDLDWQPYAGIAPHEIRAGGRVRKAVPA